MRKVRLLHPEKQPRELHATEAGKYHATEAIRLQNETTWNVILSHAHTAKHADVHGLDVLALSGVLIIQDDPSEFVCRKCRRKASDGVVCISFIREAVLSRLREIGERSKSESAVYQCGEPHLPLQKADLDV